MKTFGAEFWKLYRKGRFSKNANISRKLFNFLRFQAAITPQCLQSAGNSLSKLPSTGFLL